MTSFRSPPQVYTLDGNPIIPPVYKPLTRIGAGTNNHNILIIVNNGIVRDKDLRTIINDNMGRSTAIRRLEQSGVITRVCSGRYVITYLGRVALSEIAENGVWKNPYYKKQIRDVLIEARRNRHD